MAVRVRAPTISKEHTDYVGAQVRKDTAPAFQKLLVCSQSKQHDREAVTSQINEDGGDQLGSRAIRGDCLEAAWHNVPRSVIFLFWKSLSLTSATAYQSRLPARLPFGKSLPFL